MGYESCILINHDYYTQMADDPARFVKELWQAANKATRAPQAFPGGIAVYMDHAGSVRLLTMGRRHGTVLALSPRDFVGAHNETVQVELIRAAAKKLGYRLVKQPVKKTTPKKNNKKKNHHAQTL